MILNFCSTLLGRLLLSDHRTRHALRWWNQRQVNRLHNSAELIRDGILQDLFAIRRSLELTSDDSDASQESLRQLEALHLKLEAVSNALYPPFFGDSLPLAIQHILQDWRQQYPNLQLTSRLPQDPQVPALTSQVAITTLEELLTLMSDRFEMDTARMDVSLQREGRAAALSIRVEGSKPSQCGAIAPLSDLSHLQQSFAALTDGSLTQTVDEAEICWQMSWPLSNHLQDNSHSYAHARDIEP